MSYVPTRPTARLAEINANLPPVASVPNASNLAAVNAGTIMPGTTAAPQSLTLPVGAHPVVGAPNRPAPTATTAAAPIASVGYHRSNEKFQPAPSPTPVPAQAAQTTPWFSTPNMAAMTGPSAATQATAMQQIGYAQPVQQPNSQASSQQQQLPAYQQQQLQSPYQQQPLQSPYPQQPFVGYGMPSPMPFAPFVYGGFSGYRQTPNYDIGALLAQFSQPYAQPMQQQTPTISPAGSLSFNNYSYAPRRRPRRTRYSSFS